MRLLPAPIIKAGSGVISSVERCRSGVETDEAAADFACHFFELKIPQKGRNIQVKQLKLTQNEKSCLIFVGPTQYDDRRNVRITLAQPDPTPLC